MYTSNMQERIGTRRFCSPDTDAYAQAVANNENRWVAACGGRELPFIHNGTEWLYVFNPATGEHAYLNLGTDIVQENFQ